MPGRGSADYRVWLQSTSTVNPTDSDWNDVKTWDPVTTTQVNATAETDCGTHYRWRLFPRDGAGNQGQVSKWAEFWTDLG